MKIFTVPRPRNPDDEEDNWNLFFSIFKVISLALSVKLFTLNLIGKFVYVIMIIIVFGQNQALSIF